MDPTTEELMEIEGDVVALLRAAKLDDDEPPDLERICEYLTGAGPQLAPLGPRTEGRVRKTGIGNARRIEMRLGVLGTPRGRIVLGHECAHVYAAKYLRREVTEPWCDSFGAMLAAPRRATTLAMREVGHSPVMLGAVLEVEPEAALLRIGEVSGRPVALERRAKRLVARGEPFPWPTVQAIRELVDVHPVRVGARWGFMRRIA